MKAFDLLEADPSDVKSSQLTFLSGEDTFLKMLLTQKLVEIGGFLPEDTEKYTVESANQIAAKIAASSLFGKRLVIFDQEGKWGKTTALLRVLAELRDSEDSVIIRTSEVPLTKPALTSYGSEIECKKLSNIKARERLIHIRLHNYCLYTEEEASKHLAERTETSSDIEKVIKTLYFALPRNSKISAADIDKVTTEPSERRDITRALLKGNVPRMVKEIKEGNPLQMLVILHSSLMRLFSWLEMLSSGVGEEEAAEKLKIKKHLLRDWRTAKTKFASRTVRELMVATSQAFDDYIHGRNEWEEKLQFKISNVNLSD